VRTERAALEELKRRSRSSATSISAACRESRRKVDLRDPLKLHEQGLDKEVCTRLHLDTKEPDLRAWAAMVKKSSSRTAVRIAVVGK